jgi:ribose transport system permease protein
MPFRNPPFPTDQFFRGPNMSVTSQSTLDKPRLLPAIHLNVRDFGTLIGLLLIAGVFFAVAPGFLSERNLMNILQQSSINACVALGMTLVIISGGIDLSVGPTAALAAVLSAGLMVSGVPPIFAVLAGLCLGALCGAVNGALVSFGGLQPFIVTLGTLSTYRAVALIVTGGNPVLGVPHSFRSIANGSVSGIPVSVVVVLVVALLAGIILRKTPFGEYLLAVGGNEEAAHIAGVPIALTKIGAYVMSGVLAALAAIILIGRLGAAEPILGNLWELDAIAAAAIGGASLMGGKGSIIGTLLGAIILGAMRNGLTLLNVQAFYQLLATGLIILLAMLVDRFTRGRS